MFVNILIIGPSIKLNRYFYTQEEAQTWMEELNFIDDTNNLWFTLSLF